MDAAVHVPPDAATRPIFKEIGALLDALSDEARTIAEHRDKLHAVKEAWGQAWGEALAALARREADLLDREVELAQREETLAPAEAKLQEKSVRLEQREQTLECRSARLAQRIMAVQAEWERRVSRLRESAKTNRIRASHLSRLHCRWENEYLAETERLRAREESCEQLRIEHLRQLEAIRLKLEAVAQRERLLAEREFVVLQAEAQLLANDVDPAGARRELQNRLDRLQALVDRPLRGLEKRRKRLDHEQGLLANERLRLMQDRAHLESERIQLQRLRRELEQRQAVVRVADARTAARQRLERQELQRLRAQVRDLEQQLERVALLLLQLPRGDLRIAA
jgi:hypothetical protein